MSYMFEVYYNQPANPHREAVLNERVVKLGGRFDYREIPDTEKPGGICLTYEFDDYNCALHAASTLKQLGEHVEGPVDYGD